MAWQPIANLADLGGFVSSDTVTAIWTGTQAEYDAIDPQPGVWYVVLAEGD